ncbi:MAG: metallophosphoesterase family protein [Hyphomicrobiaceae bacterium]
MKLLLVADLHYHFKKYDWVVAAAAYVDVVVIAGDHLEISSTVRRPAQVAVVQQYFQKIRRKAKLLVCSGNHDLDGRDHNGERIAHWIATARYLDIPTDGDAFRIGDSLFSMCAWSDGNEGIARTAMQLERDAATRPAVWIWVHHAPPFGSTTSWGGKRSFGLPELSRWIADYQPDFVFSGHVHQSPYIAGGSWADKIGSTWVFNAGFQMSPPPPHLLIDLGALEVYWMSIPMVEHVRLNKNGAASGPLDAPPPDWVLEIDRAGRNVNS